MNCLLCLLAIELGVSVHNPLPEKGHLYIDDHGHRRNSGGMYFYDINYTRNPYGVVAVGLAARNGNTEWSLMLRHESSMATGQDHGTDSLQLSVRWTPFGSKP